ncbi:MAG: thioredoxin family protein [Syntrophales bacterium]|nr:thioredoxin family protein [Syntrophales bacterium]
MYKKIVSFGIAVTMFGFLLTASAFSAQAIPGPVKGMVTMIDLGAKACIPCKMMVPIMEKMEKQYAGKAAIFFIDVWKNPDEAQRFGIRSIPTQIFYKKNGEEFYRHEGFLDEPAIVLILKKLGVK